MSRAARKRHAVAASRTRGFSLIELIVVMTISGILLALAIPGYTNHILKSRRTEAKTALLDLAARQQNLFATTGAYGVSPADLGYSGGNWPLSVGGGYYLVISIPLAGSAPTNTAQIGTPPGFEIIAFPQGSQGNDSSCIAFFITATGKQFSFNSGGTDSTATCWSQ